ncbi:hydroxymethylbilane synthase [Peterkaempfera bronchialis]|uniref:Porphobilinogen deaminase n=1 Tax=Peterkaempfera bronchialis TaxID=2126346 RepID=A0A345T676_9ACTN|nr:hydroxymethylbilane synthase [Peterkaempfera bronchialis]AXI81481.1 hydroxymethylbilane synthase [Peterkaempfera bronchialis]
MNGQLSTTPGELKQQPLKLGTRRSALAMAQSGMVAEQVSKVTGRPVELVEITTYGDTSREHLSQIGGTGVFVSALRDALLDGRIDLAVHSLKDLPTAAPENLLLAAVPEREDVRDALVARDGLTLDELAEKCSAHGEDRPARIGTGSSRRMAQLNAYAAARGLAIETVPIRGNVDTRIGYVRSGELDAVVLAAAGLSRLGRLGEATQLLGFDLMLPAPGQGALAVECAAHDTRLAAALAALDHAPTRAAVVAERALLAALEVGCSAPVGALATRVGVQGPATELRLEGVVGTPDGTTLLQMSATGPLSLDGSFEQQASALGRTLAARMLAEGAAGLMGERVL